MPLTIVSMPNKTYVFSTRILNCLLLPKTPILLWVAARESATITANFTLSFGVHNTSNLNFLLEPTEPQHQQHDVDGASSTYPSTASDHPRNTYLCSLSIYSQCQIQMPIYSQCQIQIQGKLISCFVAGIFVILVAKRQWRSFTTFWSRTTERRLQYFFDSCLGPGCYVFRYRSHRPSHKILFVPPLLLLSFCYPMWLLYAHKTHRKTTDSRPYYSKQPRVPLKQMDSPFRKPPMALPNSKT